MRVLDWSMKDLLPLASTANSSKYFIARKEDIL